MAPTTETMSYHSGATHSSGSGPVSYMGDREHDHPPQKSVSMERNSSSRNLKENEGKYRMEFFKKEPCLYSHQHYKQAALIFNALKHERVEENPYLRRKQEERVKTKTVPEIPQIDFANAKDKKLAFELAFSTLKFQYLLEEMLEDVSFYSQYPEHREDAAVVMVMLQDFQTRKFHTRSPAHVDVNDPDVQGIEEAINSCTIKLNASLARNRIRHQVVSIDHLLPIAVRDTETSSAVPVYLWVNQNKTNKETVIERLTNDGFVNVTGTQELTNQMFSVDPHCDDVIVFSSEVREDIITHDYITDGLLVLQDKSSCYGPQSVSCLLNDGDDVIHINVGSGATTAHLSSLLGKKTNHIWAFGNFKSDNEMHQAKMTFEKLRAKNIKLIADRFLDTSPDDVRLKNAKVVLISAECSKSGIGNPVDFVVSEGEDMTILKQLSIGEKDNSKLSKLIANQGAILKHAMRLSKVQAIIYCTRSINQSENEEVINRAMEYANTVVNRKVPYRVQVAPPVLAFSCDDIDSGDILDGRFIKVKQSGSSNGCFVALITREPEETQESAKQILERAAAKGLLGPKTAKNRKHKETGEEENDEQQTNHDDHPVNNGIIVREKLLHRRVRKPQQKISSRTTAAPLNATAKVQTRNLSYKMSSGSYGRHSQTRHVTTRPSESITSRLYRPRIRSVSPPSKAKNSLSEYQRVIRHPAPFR